VTVAGDSTAPSHADLLQRCLQHPGIYTEEELTKLKVLGIRLRHGLGLTPWSINLLYELAARVAG
jgi:hypothetical protein